MPVVTVGNVCANICGNNICSRCTNYIHFIFIVFQTLEAKLKVPHRVLPSPLLLVLGDCLSLVRMATSSNPMTLELFSLWKKLSLRNI